MKPIKTNDQPKRGRGCLRSRLFGPALGIGLALSAALAQAGEMYWSLGMQAPGVVIGASNAAPVYVAPAPVYVAPPPVAVYPPPRMIAAPVYGAAWAPPGHFRHRHHKQHWQHGRDDWDDGWHHGRGRD